MNVRLVVILTLACVAGIFVLQNAAVVEVHFLFWSARMSRALLIVFLLAIGGLIGWFLRAYVQRRSRKIL